ncbi:MAG: 4Fe-4S dicluster domain-containing protein, partial [Bdellovibrionota bacterium]
MKKFIRNLISFSQNEYLSGRVVTDEATCTGCKICVKVCPASALEMGSNEKSKMRDGADCISCGNC